jgi:hypothetical protein
VVGLVGDALDTVTTLGSARAVSNTRWVAMLFEVDRTTRLSQVAVDMTPSTTITIALTGTRTASVATGGLIPTVTTDAPATTTIASQTFTAPDAPEHDFFAFNLNPQFNLAPGKYAIVLKSDAAGTSVFDSIVQSLTDLLGLGNANAGITVLDYQFTSNSGTLW